MSRNRKKQYKGVRYVAKVLKKYYPKRYPNYKASLPQARIVFNQIKSEGKKVTVRSINAIVRHKKGKKRNVPEIDQQLRVLSNYFALVEYPTWILRTTNQVWFTSKLWKSDLDDIQGGSLITYEEYFAEYVNYINGMKAMTNPEDNRYETEWMVKCTEPHFNRTKKRWESKIISCDGEGDEFDYGFNPKTPNKRLKSPLMSGVKKQDNVNVAPSPESTSGAEPGVSKAKDIELEKVELERDKQANIKMAMELFKNNVISKLEFKELLSKIK